MISSFVHISDTEWRLSETLDLQRRNWLQRSPPYEQIVRNLLRGLSRAKVAREHSKDIPGYSRAVVTLEVDSAALDQFYSSASGYRAQYYASPALGTVANRFALDVLLPRVELLVTDLNKSTCPARWVTQSLRDSDAKLWPHQGIWLRYARNSDKGLLVLRWLDRQQDPTKKIRTRAARSMLTPANETNLDLKGGFLSLTGQPLGTFKPDRAQHIHELGYT